MQPKIMITNNGEHPVDKWAEVTATTIVDLIEIREGSDSRQAAIARRVKLELAPKLFDVFMKHHQAAMDAEKAHLTADADTRMEHCKMHGFVATDDLDATMDEVNAIMADTPFKAHFAQEGVRTILRNIVGQHTTDVAHHEHRYHADRQAKTA